MKNKKTLLWIMAVVNILCLALNGYYVYRLSDMDSRIEVYGSQDKVLAALEDYEAIADSDAVVICKNDAHSLFVQEICDILGAEGIEEYSVNDMSQTGRLAKYTAEVYGFVLTIFVFVLMSVYLTGDVRLVIAEVKMRLREMYFTDVVRDRRYIHLAVKWLALIALLTLLAVNIVNFRFIHISMRVDLPAKGQAGEFLKVIGAAQLLWKISAVLLTVIGLIILTMRGETTNVGNQSEKSK